MAINILMVTAEAFPLAKTGGLGDAVSGLAHSLGAGGANATLMLPDYPGAAAQLLRLREVAQMDDLPGGPARLLMGDSAELGVPVLLLRNDALYDREGLYVTSEGTEYNDNALRFAALSHAATRVALGLPGLARPHVVHLHDWHTALTPLLMHRQGIEDVKTVLTLHNIAFQGVYPLSLAGELGIDQQYCNDDGLGYWGQLNFLKAGIRYADLITVVSRNYAREILTSQFGCGLEGVLAERGRDLVSIPNGIDTELWNPEADRYLPGYAFGPDRLASKGLCKAELQKTFALQPDRTATLMVMGSRLTTQKMADVAAEAIPLALDAHPALQVCVIGQGEKALEQALLALQDRYPGRCGVHIGFDEKTAHLLHAGADVLLHGSRFEPFGLTPLYSMRYGTIPIGSRVGGMVDTIVDPGKDRSAAAMRNATGILFDGEQPADMAGAIARAMSLRGLPAIWRAMQQNGMRTDFSWFNTMPAYLSAYQSLRPDVALGRIPEQQRNTVPVRGWAASMAHGAAASAQVGMANANMGGRLGQGRAPGQLATREASAA